MPEVSTPYSIGAEIEGLSLGSVVFIFDNKKVVEAARPRIGVLHKKDGTVNPIFTGNASVLEAQDLESISLIDEATQLFVATSSLGATHVFTIEGSASTNCSLRHVAKGQLPVPETESTRVWSDPNRTNIEATKTVRQKDGTHIMIWGARGGSNYAGTPGPSKSVWVRQAPFDPTTGMIDETQMRMFSFPSVGSDGWRALSSMDFDDKYMYNSTCFDGEEEGFDLDLTDAARTSSANRAAFRSMILRTSFATGETQVLAHFDGMKVEAVMLGHAVDANGRRRLYLGSDDEGLGSLFGSILLPSGDSSKPLITKTNFVDLASASSAHYPQAAHKRWGLSGMAPRAAWQDDQAEANTVLSVFQVWDKAGDGRLQKSDLVCILERLTGSRDLAHAAVANFPADENGRINYAEFIEYVFGVKL